MSSPSAQRRWFVAGDLNGFFGLVVDNLSILGFIAMALIGIFGFPAEVVYQRMFPGTALGVLVALWYSSGVSLLPVMTAPRGVLVIDWAFSLLALFGARVLVRVGRDRFRPADPSANTTRVLIIGAGDAGETLAREIEHRPQLGMRVVGFVDDQRAKWGSHIRGINVHGPISRLAELADSLSADEALIAIPSASGKRIREIIPSSRVTWTRRGVNPEYAETAVGTGTFAAISTLPVGEHLFTVTATAADGLQASAQVILFVKPLALTVKIGSLRSNAVLLAGGQATLNAEIEVREDVVVKPEDVKWRIRPYGGTEETSLGAGLSIATLVTHGTADTNVEFSGGEYAAQYWSEHNGCSATTTASTPAPCETYDGCPADKPVKRCFIEGQGHPLWDQALTVEWAWFKALP
jgi:hypothetical protein